MNKTKKTLLVGIFSGGSLIAAALILKYLTSTEIIDIENSRRAMQVIISVFIIACVVSA